jgi:nucleoside-diphosphate-sugar epimerase
VREHIFITGGDGYAGGAVARRYLNETDASLTLLLRAATQDAARAKRERVCAELPPEARRRVSFVHDDLSQRDALAGLDARTVTTILHCAAVTRFNVERDLAEAVNVEGTKRVLEFARRCPQLTSCALLSTAYSCGLEAGAIDERPALGGRGFANHYEWSKLEAERLALELEQDLPLRILRIATIFANGDDGSVGQYNAFHNTFKLYYYGLLSLVPGARETPVYLVTGDFVAQQVFSLTRDADARGIFHVLHRREHNPTLGELIDLMFTRYEADESFRRKRILRPIFTDHASFQALSDSTDSLGSAIMRQALRSMSPFARQLYVQKDFDNRRLRSAVPDYEPPDYRAQIVRAIEHMIETKWGKASASRATPELRSRQHDIRE